MEIKPIETRYAGCRFRSRLEARWAVVFDHLDIAWRYELQGYEIPGGERYLPDFWLPTLALWVEVKGRFGDGEWEKVLAAVGSGLPGDPDDSKSRYPRLLVLGDLPRRTEGVPLHWLLVKTASGQVQLRQCVLGVDAFMEYGWRREADRVIDPNLLLDQSYLFPETEAYEAGRSARFEFGESG